MKQDWVLPLKDGTTIQIPANKISDINKKLANKEPITTQDRTILWQDIAAGPYKYVAEAADADLAEQAAIAFNEPMLTANNEVQCTWFKETVSAARWNKYYVNFPCYYKLGNNYDNVIMAYRLPAHYAQLVENTVDKCTPSEVAELEARLHRS